MERRRTDGRMIFVRPTSASCNGSHSFVEVTSCRRKSEAHTVHTSVRLQESITGRA